MADETNESSIPASYSMLDTDERIIIDLSRQCQMQRQEIARLSFEMVRHRRDAVTANVAFDKAERQRLQTIDEMESERMIHRNAISTCHREIDKLTRRLKRKRR